MNNVQALVHLCPESVGLIHEESWIIRKLVDPKRVGRINEGGGEEGKRKEGEWKRERMIKERKNDKREWEGRGREERGKGKKGEGRSRGETEFGGRQTHH